MALTNFRASDFKKGGESVKVARSKRDRVKAPAAPKAQVADPNAVPEGTIPEVLGWVGDDKERAQKALDAELKDEKPRKGLVDELSSLVKVEEPEDEPESDEESEDSESTEE